MSRVVKFSQLKVLSGTIEGWTALDEKKSQYLKQFVSSKLAEVSSKVLSEIQQLDLPIDEGYSTFQVYKTSGGEVPTISVNGQKIDCSIPGGMVQKLKLTDGDSDVRAEIIEELAKMLPSAFKAAFPQNNVELQSHESKPILYVTAHVPPDLLKEARKALGYLSGKQVQKLNSKARALALRKPAKKSKAKVSYSIAKNRLGPTTTVAKASPVEVAKQERKVARTKRVARAKRDVLLTKAMRGMSAGAKAVLKRNA